jgi:hypothetical protein
VPTLGKLEVTSVAEGIAERPHEATNQAAPMNPITIPKSSLPARHKSPRWCRGLLSLPDQWFGLGQDTFVGIQLVH